MISRNIGQAAIHVARHWRATATIVGVLSVGIAAATSIFAMADALFIRPLPLEHSEGLVLLDWRATGALPASIAQGEFQYPAYHGMHEMHHPRSSTSFSYPTFLQVAEHSDVLSSAFAFAPLGKAWYGDGRLNIQLHGRGELARGEMVTDQYFSALEVVPALGRMLMPEDQRKNVPVAVLSYSYWTRRFSRDPAVLNEHLVIGNLPYSIVGVASEHFNGLVEGMPADFWIPVSDRVGLTYWGHPIADLQSAMWWGTTIGARLKPGVSLEQARSELEAAFVHSITVNVASPPSPEELPQLGLSSLTRPVPVASRQLVFPMQMLMAFGALVLLICCLNASVLMLERGVLRRSEIAVRVALGASRPHVLAQLCAESAFVVMSAVCGGLLAAGWITQLLSRQFQDILSPLGLTMPEVQLDLRVVAFSAGLTALAVILSALVPAWLSTGHGAAESLRVTTPHVFRGTRHRLTDICVLIQLSMSAALLVIAVVFVRSAHSLLAQRLGFNPDRLLVFTVVPPKTDATPSDVASLYWRLQQSLDRTAGAVSVTASVLPPVAGQGAMLPVIALGDTPEPKRLTGRANLVGPRFFETLGIPMLAGRAIDSRDVKGSLSAVVVNRQFVSDVYGSRNPLGETLRIPGAGLFTIVGVSENAVYESVYETKMADGPKGVLYLSYSQLAPGGFDKLFFQMRLPTTSPRSLSAVTAAIESFDPTLAVGDMTWEDDLIRRSVWREATASKAASLAGLLFLAIVAVSVTTTLSYKVAERRYEFAVKAALGASRPQLFWAVLSRGLWVAAGAAVLGLPMAYVLLQWLRSQFENIEVPTAVAFAMPVAVIAAACLLAAAGPAYKACTADPRAALMGE